MKNKQVDPYTRIDLIYTKLEDLENLIANLFRSLEDTKHKGTHLRIQETLDLIFEELRELRMSIYERNC